MQNKFKLVFYSLIITEIYNNIANHSNHKDRLVEKVTIYFPIFYLVKSLANVLFFYLVLPNYMASETTKEF